MPHARKRSILTLLEKKLTFSRIVTLQGCRQSGKSFLAREILQKLHPGSKYLTFDQKVQKTFAQDNPESFLKRYIEATPLILDEAQKVSDIFDAIKFEVDQNPKPGQYVLLGSTEFSKLLHIRESLTGRMSRLRLFPLTLSECLEIEPPSVAPLAHLLHTKPRATRTALLKHFERGGFPGIFAVRDEASRNDFFQDWINLTLERDLHQFPGISVDTELAREILQRLVLLPEPTASNLARAVRRDTRAVQKILTLFETLFVVHRLNPFREGTGKSLYFLCDVGLANSLGADFERQLWTWLLQEQLAQRGFQADEGWRLFHFRSSKGKFIHLVAENLRLRELTVIKILSCEKMDLREIEILKAFRRRIQPEFKKVRLIAWGPMPHGEWDDSIETYPWESLV